MNSNEVRNIDPNQFVKLKILKSHVETDQEFIDEMVIIGPIDDANATKELLNSKGTVLVYHTLNSDFILQLRTRIGVRRPLIYEQ